MRSNRLKSTLKYGLSVLVLVSLVIGMGRVIPASAQAGILDHVTVSPASVNLSPAATQQFTAQGFDAAGNPIAGLSFLWNVAAGGGTISSTGLLTAGATLGTFTNTVQALTVQGGVIKLGAASVTVATPVPGVLDHVTVTPASATVMVGNTQQFTAEGFDAAGVAVAGLSFTWSVVAGGGTINASGLFTAGATAGAFANTVQAVAVQGAVTKAGLASVTVSATPGPLDHVTVAPASASVAAGATQQFTAQGFDAANNPISGLSFTWNVVAGGGTINASGLFTAGVTTGAFANTVQAIAAQGAIIKIGTASVTVTVAPGPLDHVTVTPASASVAAGATQQFTAQGFDAASIPISGLSFTWNVVAGGGTINALGLFTAGATAGSFANTVQAIAAQGAIVKIGTASVTVTAAPVPVPVAEKPAAKKLLLLVNASVDALGFEHFLGAQWSIKEDGQTMLVKAIPGIVKAIGDASVTLLPNGQTEMQVFSLAGSSRILAGQHALKVDDKAVVVTVDDATRLVIPIPIRGVADLDREDRRGPNRGKEDDDEGVRDEIKEMKEAAHDQAKDLREALRDRVKDLREALRDQLKDLRQGSNRGRG